MALKKLPTVLKYLQLINEISRKTSKSSQDPFKTVIDNQQKDWFTSDNITQIIQANPFSYVIQSGTFFLKFFIHPQSKSGLIQEMRLQQSIKF